MSSNKMVTPKAEHGVQNQPNMSSNKMATPKAKHGVQNQPNTSSNKMATPKAEHNVQSSSIGIVLSDHDFVDEAYMDMFLEGSLSDEEYALLLQAQFDGIQTFTAPIENTMKVDTHSKKSFNVGLSDHDFVDEKAYMDLLREGLMLDDEYAFSSQKKSNAASSSSFSSKLPPGASSSSSAVPGYPPESSNSKRKYNVFGSSGHYRHKPVVNDPNLYAKSSCPYNLENKSFGKDKLTPAEYATVKTGSASITNDHESKDEIVKSSYPFKQFDTVEDFSDHHYFKTGSAVKQQSKNWAKRIQEEWKILEKDLPNKIFVRAYESRMDLMRAVIVGAQGTPYHDGLFFFDIFFPEAYPSAPPQVYYHSGGLRINPNLYNGGKVCLSLLNTWSGNGNEKWIPNGSTMLQVLVSIQALILNEKPYFNEPGHTGSAGSVAGEQRSQTYSENAFNLSLKTMVYSMRKPPKHFEVLVTWHFRNHAQDILSACKLYIENGAQVGSVTKSRSGIAVQANAKKCSARFQSEVASHITMLVEAFVQIGAKDCDKFLSLAPKGGSNLPRGKAGFVS